MSSSLFHFRCSTPSNPRHDAVLVIFSGPTGYNRNAVTDAVGEETRLSLAPEAAYLMYPDEDADEAIADLSSIESPFAALPEEADIVLYQYDSAGVVTLGKVLRGKAPVEFPAAHVCRQGLTAMLNRHKGVLDAGPTAHFIRPSQRPSTRFLRASHALSDGAEIYFAAFWLLPHFSDDLTFVHVDTSAIASVVFACLLMKKAKRQPAVLTFHSYQGFATHPFSRDRADLVVISASQSGTMAAEAAERVADPSRVITLFSSASPLAGTKVLCDIRRDGENHFGVRPPREIADTSDSRPIRLISEHFIVEPEPSSAVIPGTKHAPDVVKDVLMRLVGDKVMVALKSTNSGEERLSVWIDTERLSQSDLFKSWIEHLVSKFIPATTKVMVVLDGERDSVVVADAIMAEVKRQGGTLNGMKRVTLDELETSQMDWNTSHSPIVVACSASGRGTGLLDASRALRRYAPDSHRIFVTPCVTSINKRSIELLRSNLKQPSYVFETRFELVIDRRAAAASWHDERLLLLGVGGDLPFVEARIDVLDGMGAGRTDGLFLEGPHGALRLRDNFAFWDPNTLCCNASQADVFTTITAIMENMRSEAVELKHRLVNDAQTHTVLNAETFARYNDGVIQAAFLRASRPLELNYTDNEACSRLMLNMLTQMIEYGDRQQGEALAEFLLAIACSRLRLTDSDHTLLINILKQGLPKATEIARWLATSIIG